MATYLDKINLEYAEKVLASLPFMTLKAGFQETRLVLLSLIFEVRTYRELEKIDKTVIPAGKN